VENYMQRRDFIALLGAVFSWPFLAHAPQKARSRQAAIIAAIGITLLLLVAPAVAKAEQPSKVYRLGFLTGGGQAAAVINQAFREQLRTLGYVEGRNLVFEFRSAEGNPERFPSLAEELVRMQPDVIVAPSTGAATALQRLSRTIPIVFALAADPVGSGLAVSLARPGGNATGLSTMNTELAAKRVELLKDALPTLTQVAVLWAAPEGSPGTGTLQAIFREMETSGRGLGVTLDVVKVSEGSELENAFATIGKRQHQALVVLPTPIYGANISRIAELSLQRRLAAVGDNRQFADVGGLMAYGANWSDQLRRAAAYVDKIFKGMKPADLPIEQPTRFELVVNLKTAQALGLTIPPSILARADEVIE
jgi:putative ABC transport system substrate-binding protein